MSKHQRTLMIAVAATFTAEPIEESLRFWIERLGLEAEIEFAPYNQVFQELLDAGSLFSRNENGVNILVVRLEDWFGYDADMSEDQSAYPAEKIERNVEDLIEAIRTAASRTPASYFLCLSPSSPACLADKRRTGILDAAERRLSQELASAADVYVITSERLLDLYDVANYYDEHGDKNGCLPYTPEFYTAIGTMLARGLYAITNDPYKAIVLDCDNTLWTGICGEAGADGVEINETRKLLQRFMLDQSKAGMLLCICSKNNQEDVFEVFDDREEMLLKREHIAAWRVNWRAKSQNIESLAQELGLGLDSFIFIDDDPAECAEVEANCPEVLTLELPRCEESIEIFLRHVWAMDHLKAARDVSNRTLYYQQNRQRDQIRDRCRTLEDFIEGLGLKVTISNVRPDQMARVAELTRRTNQFNCTAVRRRETEIEHSIAQGCECEVVEVEDRFGCYGIVGVMIYEKQFEALKVDTFLLSCRALGRRVEHRMIARLGEIASQRGLPSVQIPFIQTQKNKPAFEFLESIGGRLKQSNGPALLYSFPARYATGLGTAGSAG